MTVAGPESLIADLTARTTRAGQEWQNGLTVADIRPLAGGSSSLTYVADTEWDSGKESLVLKVAPPGLAPVRNRDVVRQGRLMQALRGADGVKIPAVYFSDDGTPPEISPFVAMELIAGECVEPLLADERDEARRPQVRARFLDAARMLANLHRVDPATVGLADEPVMSLASEIDRWTRAFETVPEDLQGEFRLCEKVLHESIPAQLTPVINHGDYRLGNTLCEGDRVNSIIDWEIWSVGDPRIDLTWLTYFTDEAGHPAAPSTEPCGTPTVAEVVAAYEEALGSTLPDIEWFDALTRYKEAALTGLLIKRARRNNNMKPSFARMEPALPGLVREALTLLGA